MGVQLLMETLAVVVVAEAEAEAENHGADVVGIVVGEAGEGVEITEGEVGEDVESNIGLYNPESKSSRLETICASLSDCFVLLQTVAYAQSHTQ